MTDPALTSFDAFRRLPHAITLLGMSGVGKTALSSHLRRTADWFHFSADYRIGTRYLAERIVDNVKFKIMRMEDQFVAELLRSDSIYINHNITVDNLAPVSTFLGMFGDPAQGGLHKRLFLKRQRLYAGGERQSMMDTERFIDKSWNIYRCKDYVNDASGSLCEVIDLDDPGDPVASALAEDTLLLYVRAGEQDEEEFKRRAVTDPKPLFYHPDFIMPRLAGMPDDGVGVDVKQFARDLFPDLIEFRRPRYQKMADQMGFTLDAGQLYRNPASPNPMPDPDVFLKTVFTVMCNAVEDSPVARANAETYLKACRRRAEVRGMDV